MKMESKYNIGQTIAFTKEKDNKIIIANITDIRIYAKMDNIDIYYDTDYPEINYDDFGECVYGTLTIAEDQIIGVAEIKIV